MKLLRFSILWAVGVGWGAVLFAQNPPPMPQPTPNPAPLIKAPEEVKTAPGVQCSILVETQGTTVKWFTAESTLSFVPREELKDPKKLYFSGSAPGNYVVWVFSSVKDIPTDPIPVRVVVLGATPPQPNPNPNPAPNDGIDRTDPLFIALNNAYSSDPQMSGKVGAKLLLSAMYRNFADIAAKSVGKSAKGFNGLLKDSGDELLQSNNQALPALRETVRAQMRQIIPATTGAEVITEAQAKSLASMFLKVSHYLEAIK